MEKVSKRGTERKDAVARAGLWEEQAPQLISGAVLQHHRRLRAPRPLGLTLSVTAPAGPDPHSSPGPSLPVCL